MRAAELPQISDRQHEPDKPKDESTEERRALTFRPGFAGLGPVVARAGLAEDEVVLGATPTRLYQTGLYQQGRLIPPRPHLAPERDGLGPDFDGLGQDLDGLGPVLPPMCKSGLWEQSRLIRPPLPSSDVRTEELAKGPGPHTVHGTRLEIHEDCTRDIAATRGFVEVDVDSLLSTFYANVS